MRYLSGVLFVVVTLAFCPRATADQQENGKGLGDRVQDLALTSEQEAKIEEIRKECRPKIDEAAKELAGVAKEEMEKIREVLTPEQKQKLQAFREERKEHRMEGVAQKMAHLHEIDLTDAEKSQVENIRNEFQPKLVNALEGLKGVLNSDQTRAREDSLKAGKNHREVIASLNLTEAQKEKCQSVCKEVANLVGDEMDKIKALLTAEQREKLSELKDERRERVRDRWAHRVANAEELNLTDEQKAKIAEIRKEFRPKIHDAGNKLRAAVREELDMIVKVMKG